MDYTPQLPLEGSGHGECNLPFSAVSGPCTETFQQGSLQVQGNSSRENGKAEQKCQGLAVTHLLQIYPLCGPPGGS